MGDGCRSVFDREADVDEVFDGRLALNIHVSADAVAVIGHLVHHFSAGLTEPLVVFEEVAVPVDVGHDELLVDDGVIFEEVGITGIVIDDQLVDLREAVAVALERCSYSMPNRQWGSDWGTHRERRSR